MTIMERIELNPKVCNGKPVIKGTRIPISVILEQIAQGESWDDLLNMRNRVRSLELTN